MDIWVGIDGSPHADAACIWAAQLADAITRPELVPTLHLVHCWQFPQVWSASAALGRVGEQTANPTTVGQLPTVTEMQSSSRGVADKALERVADALPPTIRVAVPIGAQGEPDNVLVDLAGPDDIIVVGSRGLGGVKGLLLGSVSSRLASRTRCPLIVLPAGAALPGSAPRIVVGMECTEQARRAGLWAAEMFADALIDLVRVWQIPALAAMESGAYGIADLESAAQEGLTQMLHELGEEVERPDRLRTILAEGDPRRMLVEAATGADLLVIGAQRHHGIGRVLLGSVAQNLLHHLRVPIAVVPVPATDSAM